MCVPRERCEMRDVEMQSAMIGVMYALLCEMPHQQLVLSMQVKFLHNWNDYSNYTQYYAIDIALWTRLSVCVCVDGVWLYPSNANCQCIAL